jgi:hypothetical protein
MKLFNLFKKETTNAKKTLVQKLEKNQLEKVIGGGNGDVPTTQAKTYSKTKSNTEVNL